jgi:hypothetical protein
VETQCLKLVVTRGVPVVASCVPVVNSGIPPVVPTRWSRVRMACYFNMSNFSSKYFPIKTTVFEKMCENLLEKIEELSQILA